MVKFDYNGSGILAFTHQEKDYVIHEKGPHELPDDNELVKSLVAQKLLIANVSEADKSGINNTKEQKSDTKFKLDK